MNKKIAILALALCMVAAIAVTGTIAYFTDTDNETNEFTIGDVQIDLIETFDPDNAKLIPGKDIQKEVFVKNEGSETAYVRVHVAFPKALDSGSPDLNASKNSLHWNFTEASVQEGAWSQLQNSAQVGPNGKYPNWPGNGGTYNTYTTTLDDGIEYNVYVMTYETALGAGETTPENAISKVYLDKKVTDEQLAAWNTALKGIKVPVFAEGGQVEGFTDPYVALNTQFGDPMATGYVDPWTKNGVKIAE